MSGIVNDPTLKILAYALDGLSTRQKAIANNVANVDTPGYKAERVQFEAQLAAAIRHSGDGGGLPLKTTNTRHLGHTAPFEPGGITITKQNNTMRNDGNSVDIDLEMTELAETTIRFQALSQLTGMKISLLKNIIRESR